MFLVYKNNRKQRLLFDTYENARQYIRRKLRTLTTERRKGQPVLPMWTFGYEIRRV